MTGPAILIGTLAWVAVGLAAAAVVLAITMGGAFALGYRRGKGEAGR